MLIFDSGYELVNIFILLQQKGVQIDLNLFSPFFQFHEKQQNTKKKKKVESSHQKHISIKNNGNGQIFTS